MLVALTYPPIPALELGPISVSLHGVMAGVGFVLGSLWMLREVRRRGYDAEGTASALTWALVGAIIGARLFTIPAHVGDPGYGFSDAIAVAGDYSIMGGFAGGIIAGLVRGRMLGMPMVPYLDMVAAPLALGTVIGRIGDLLIVEHLGSETSFFLGYTLTPENAIDIAPQHSALTDLCVATGQCLTYHHTALYDLLGALVLFGVLVALPRVWKSAHYGQLFAVWVIWYGLQRFLIDFTRLEAAKAGTVSDSVMGPLTGSQWGALGAALLGVGLFVFFRARYPVVSAENDAAIYGAEIPGIDAGEAEEPRDDVAGTDALDREPVAADEVVGDGPEP